jgi:hypothetical protein
MDIVAVIAVTVATGFVPVTHIMQRINHRISA